MTKHKFNLHLHCLLAGFLFGGIFAVTHLSGCKTTPCQPTDPAKVQKAAVVLKGTTTASMLILIDKYGQNARAYTTVARDALNEFMLTKDLTPGALQKSLSKLPIKELNKPEVQLVLTSLVTAYELYYTDLTGVQNTNAVVLITAIRDGLTTAIELTPDGTIQQLQYYQLAPRQATQPQCSTEGICPLHSGIHPIGYMVGTNWSKLFSNGVYLLNRGDELQIVH